MIAKADRFLPFSTKLDFPASEGKVLELWKEIHAFEEGLQRRENGRRTGPLPARDASGRFVTGGVGAAAT